MASLTPQEERALVNGLKEGSKSSFRAFYDLYYIPLFYFARGFVTDEQAAEDVATEAFIRLWKKHQDFDSADKVRNFLYLAARNLAVDHLRRTKRRISRDTAFSNMVTEPPVEALRQEEITGELFQAIYKEAEKLPAQLREVFNLAYLQGLSNELIAKQMGISDQTVRNYKAQGLRTIRAALAGRDLFSYLLFIIFFR